MTSKFDQATVEKIREKMVTLIRQEHLGETCKLFSEYGFSCRGPAQDDISPMECPMRIRTSGPAFGKCILSGTLRGLPEVNARRAQEMLSSRFPFPKLVQLTLFPEKEER